MKKIKKKILCHVKACMSVTYVTIQLSRGFVPTLLNFRFFRCGTISFVLTR